MYHIVFVKMCVVQNIKDTFFCNQITTVSQLDVVFLALFRISKIHFFVTKSQRIVRCIQNCCVVQNIKDTFFCNQITTPSGVLPLHLVLFRISKIHFFVTKSQQNSDLSSPHQSCSEYQRYIFL